MDNLVADHNDESVDLELQKLLQQLDPDQPDSFSSSNFDKEKMDFLLPSHSKHKVIPREKRPQIDLLCVLDRAGVSLAVHDKTIDWVIGYKFLNGVHHRG